jgi:lysylphosphatidylglycerol synthetase-like protein (DUF2156 family)
MLVVLIIVSVVLLCLIIYIAVSAKSSRIHRLSAVIALGLICISIIICGIFIIRGPAEEPDLIFPVFQDVPPVKEKSGIAIADIVIMLIMLGIISLVIHRAIKEQKRIDQTMKKAKPAPVKRKAEPSNEIANEEQETEEKDDTFNLGFD